MRVIGTILALAFFSLTVSGAFAPVLANAMDGKPKKGNCQSQECKRYYNGK